jgi:hypothetical protein
MVGRKAAAVPVSTADMSRLKLSTWMMGRKFRPRA